jgi:hypothetical protein
MKINIIRFLLAVLTFCDGNGLRAQGREAIWKDLAGLPAKNDTQQVQDMNKIAGMYYMSGLKDSAAWYLREALKLSEKNDYHNGLWATYSNFGAMELQNRNFAISIDYFKKALDIAEQYNFKQNILQHNIALVLSTEEKYEEAILFFQKSIKSGVIEQDTLGLIFNHSGIGNCYLSMGDTINSYTYNLEAQRVCAAFVKSRKLSDYEQMVVTEVSRTITINNAQIKVKRNEFKEAVGMILPVWEQRHTHTDTVQMSRMLKTLAEGYEGMNELEKAVYYTRVADTLIGARMPQYKDMCRNIYEIQARLYARMGKYEHAYKAQQKYQVAKDSCTDAGNTKNINDVLTKYETEKKTQEIDQLKKERRTQRLLIGGAAVLAVVTLALLLLAYRSKRLQSKLFRQQQQLNKQQYEKELATLEQKALRAQMNPHFIFNALNSIHKYVASNDAAGADRFINTFAGLIRQTLDNSGKPFLTLGEETAYLQHYLQLEAMRQPGRFRYEVSVDDNIDAAETYFPGMLVQPFLENSVLHGFPPGLNREGLIRVHFKKNGRLECLVEDDGVGRRAVKHIIATHESKGVNITENRIKNLNRIYGSNIALEVEDVSDAQGQPAGTCVHILVPLDLSR